MVQHVSSVDDLELGDAHSTTPDGAVITFESEGLARWTGHPDGHDVWFRWFEGKISARASDPSVVRRAVAIAEALGGRVQGDEGEFHDGSSGSSGRTPPRGSGFFVRFRRD